MLEPGSHLDLAKKPLGTQRRGELRVKDLERDVPSVPEIPREVNRCHATPAELALDVVAVQNRGLKAGCMIGQRRSGKAHP